MVWFGYNLPPTPCECCRKTGKVTWDLTGICPICKGKGSLIPIVEVPIGFAYQIWVTKNYLSEHDIEYYPISPIFKDEFGMAEWCGENIVINGDPLNSEKIWYDAIQDDNVDVMFGLYRESIQLSSDLK